MPKLQQRKQTGFTIIELLIVIAIIAILATLVLTNFQGAQAKGRDSVRQNDINSLHSKLEEFHNENSGYPNNTLSTTNLPGIDAGVFDDADGGAIKQSFITAGAATGVAVTNASGDEYSFEAFGCTTAGASATATDVCTGYELRAYQERTAGNLYQKNSLNN